MTKVIGAFIIVLLIWGGWELFLLWDKYDTEQDLKQKESVQRVIVPEQLPGMPQELKKSYEIAQKNGSTGVRNWLRDYGMKVEDPRRAWIELDYMIMIARDDPAEAKKIFADVKARTPENSPIYPRIKELTKTYE